jgi:protein-disulfide isomerase
VATKPKETKAQARERLREERARQAAADARRKRLVTVVLVGVVVLAVAVVGFLVVNNRSSTVDTSGAVPAGVTDTKGYPFGSVDTPVLDIWEDFQCPNCGDFEAANRTKIEELISQGKAKVAYHTWDFLDQNFAGKTPNPDSSARAAMAAACAWDQGRFLQFHDQVFSHQPATEGQGWTDQQLEQFAKDAGVADTATFDQCLSSRKYASWISQIAGQADKQQIVGTPTFLVNGQQVNVSGAADWGQVGDKVVQAVEKAGASASPAAS